MTHPIILAHFETSFTIEYSIAATGSEFFHAKLTPDDPETTNEINEEEIGNSREVRRPVTERHTPARNGPLNRA